MEGNEPPARPPRPSIPLRPSSRPSPRAVPPPVPAHRPVVESQDTKVVEQLTRLILDFLETLDLEMFEKNFSEQVSGQNRKLAKLLVKVLNKACEENQTVAQLERSLQAFGLAGTRTVCEVWKERREQVIEAVCRRAVTLDHELLGMEHRFGFTLCNEEVEGIHVPFVQLQFLRRSGTSAVEVSIDQFYQLFAELQRAKAMMDNNE